MADMARMESALRNAHAAGDTVAAKAIANAIKQARMGAQPQGVDQGTMAMVGQAGTQSGDIGSALSDFTRGKPTDKAAQDLGIRANMEARVLRDRNPLKGTPLDYGIFGTKGQDFVMGVADAVPFFDEITGALTAPARMVQDRVGPVEAYNRQKALTEAQVRKAREESPLTTMAGTATGAIGGGAALAGRGLSLSARAANAGLPARIAAGAGEGAAYGALAGAGANDENRLAGASSGALTGAVAGGAVPLVGAGMRSLGGRIGGGTPPAPTREALAAQGDELYTAAKNAGVTLKPGAMTKVKSNLGMQLREFGFDVDLQPKTATVLKRLGSASDEGMSLTELENLRKMASTVAREAGDASDRTTAGMVVEQIDNLIDDAGNFSANSSKALGALKDAREVWKRKIKMDVLDQINEKAMNQATGYENGIVIQLRSLANNPKRLKLFSQTEQKMIKDAVRRGNVRGMLRAFGMLSPTSTFGGIVTGGVGVGTGIVPGAALGGIGYASRRGAEAMTRGQFARIQDAAARGYVQQPNAGLLGQMADKAMQLGGPGAAALIAN